MAKTVAKTKKMPKRVLKVQFEGTKKHQHQSPSKLFKLPTKITFSPRTLPGPLKSSPNGKISPNLVTLPATV
jgi:hypothetical protein